MEKWWFNLILSNERLEDRYGLSKSTDSLDGIGHTPGSEDPILNDTEKNILLSWSDSGSYSYSFSNVNYLLEIRNIFGLISDNTSLVRDSNGDSYSVYFDIENPIFEIDNKNNSSFLSELESFFYSYLNSGSKSKNNYYVGYIYSIIWTVNVSISVSSSESGSSSISTSSNGSDLNIKERSNDFDINKKYKDLWVQCENCYGLNYKKFFKSKMHICEHCGYHLKMSSSDRIELSIDPGTWDPMDEAMVSMDPIEFHSEEEPYIDRIDSYQRKTGLTEAVQTGIGQLNGIPVTIGVMDFEFMGGSMGSVVGEKITRLIEYATNKSLPVIIVCASGGARMQEGSLSLMQMAKISSASYNYQSNKKLFYVSILTSPTTGGVTASFGMLGNVIIAEPNAHIAFAGKRVIEQTLNKTIPDGLQAAEYLFHKGLFDLIVPRNPLKGVLSELFQLHGFLPLNQKNKKRIVT
uniref:Acetyl-coenzyme A carboxylase carboxyl transferase subunit beta, chloroplastic n=1 Tax=Trichopus zeylanicus subsp. travancoricus TaxID=459581 RepID=A0A516MUN0_9LILI|nr:AccD [Trichopus zeylanicus subsp. travancoricus]QDP69927.1 AccD [Trichopus zeylanicus subsp. travancoricus]